MNETTTGRQLVCCLCDGWIECCEFCDGEDCPKAICYRCVIVAVGQEIPQIHPHGG